MNFLWKLAFRNLLRHKWRSLATVLGISLGIAAVLATLSVGDNVRANIASTLEASTGKADLLVTPGSQGRAIFNVDDIYDLLANNSNVEKVYPVLNFRAEPIRTIEGFEKSVIPGVDSGFQISARLTQFADDLPSTLVAGEFPQKGSMAIAIAANFAKDRGIKLGDMLEFKANQASDFELKVVGLLDHTLGYASTNGSRVGISNYYDLSEILKYKNKASFFELILKDSANLEKTKEELSELVGDKYAVTLPSTSGNITFGIIDTLQASLSILAITLLALGGFMAYNTFAATIVERSKEYALLRTICLTKGQVKSLALSESFILSIAGVVTGILIGILLSLSIVKFNSQLLGYEFRTLVVPSYAIIISSVVGILVSLLAGLLPAISASNTSPIAAVRRTIESEKAKYPGLGFLILIIGVLAALLPWHGLWALMGGFISIAFIFLGISLMSSIILKPFSKLASPILERIFGLAGKLGADFALRNSVRNGVAIGTVVIGISLTIGVGGTVSGISKAVEDWVYTTIIGDMFVTSPVSFPNDFEKQITEQIPEIDQTSGVGIRVVRFAPENQTRKRTIALILVDPERFDPKTGFGKFQYLAGNNQQGYEALKAGGKVLAANTMHDRFGINLGDTVSIRTKDGFADFPVEGIVVDFTSGGETFVASINDLELFGGGSPDLYVMTVKNGITPQEAKDKLLKEFPELYLDITLNKAYQERILSFVQQSFTSTNSLLALAIFIAALSVANTLGMSLVNRKHDIAVLRTIGLTRRDIRYVILSEGIIVSVLGTIIGLAVGMLLARVITLGASALTGFILEPYIPLKLILISIIISPILGIIASLLPARKAAMQSPVVALGGQT